MTQKYKNINLPIELVDEIDEHIEENPQKGYSSRAEFAKEAIRNHLRLEGRWESTEIEDK